VKWLLSLHKHDAMTLDPIFVSNFFETWFIHFLSL
jgi:hypothetical protein